MDYANKTMHYGSSHNELAELPRTPTDEEKMKTVDCWLPPELQRNPTEEEKRKTIVGWVPPNDLPRTSKHLKPYKYDQIGWNQSLGILSPPTPSPNVDITVERPPVIESQPDGGTGVELRANLMERMQSLISSSDKTDTPAYINEDNTSIFLNAVTGMFFPSCHTHLEAFGSELAISDPQAFYIRNCERQDKLIQWQCSVYQRQVYLFNTLLMILISVIIILVSSVQTFNYNTNVINSFWFAVTMSMLLLSGTLSILTTWGLTRHVTNSEKSYGSSSPDAVRRNKYSDSLSCRRLMIKAFICIITLLIVLIPIIISLIIFSSVSKSDPYIFLINENGKPDSVELSIITAFPVHYHASNEDSVTKGIFETECYIDEMSDFKGKILLINATKPKCRTLMLEDGFYKKSVMSNASGIVLLDDTPKSQWRVSSPLSEKIHSLVETDMEGHHEIPLLLVRELDWRKFDKHFLELSRNQKQIFLVWNDPKSLDLKHLFTCTKNNSVIIEPTKKQSVKGRGDCSDGKHLYSDGVLSEKICVTGECSVHGQPCPHSAFDNLKQFSVDLECDSLTNINLEISEPMTSDTLSPGSLELTSMGSQTDYCCINDDSRDFNSTFIEVS